MKLTIGGHEIEVPRHEVHAVVQAFKDPTPLTTRPEESGKTDATGLVVIPIYVVPAAMEWRGHLLNVEADGFTPAAPYNGAGAFWQLRVSERVVDEGSLVAAAVNGWQIPFTKSYGFMGGAVAYNLETVDLRIVNGPANALIRAFMQGSLLPKPAESPPEK